MKREDHEKATFEVFGKPFSEVHAFLDQFHVQFPGGNHRRVLHHMRGVDLVEQHFGKAARGPAILHIYDDFGFLPESWTDLDDYFVPLREGEEEEMEQLIIKLFGDLDKQDEKGTSE